MVKTYHYVFSPLDGVNLAEERCELGGAASLQRVDGAALEQLWRWMEHNNSDPRYWPYGEAPAEAAFLVKELEVVKEVKPAGYLELPGGGGEMFGVKHQSYPALDRDVFWKERLCLNLCLNRAIATPIAFCSDDFPVVKRGSNWESAVEEWSPGDPTGSQQIGESIASTIRDRMMASLVGECLDKHEWLKCALITYGKASRLGREPSDQFVDYWDTLEALFTDKSKKDITAKLVTRLAMVLTHAGEERNRFYEFYDRIKKLKKLYDMSSKKRHEARKINEGVVPALRRATRRSILMALELSRRAGSEKEWDAYRQTLYEKANDPDQIEELGRIRSGWSAVW